MKQLFIIRHGETDVNKAGMIQGRSIDAPINNLGHQQASAIVEALESFSVQKIVTSSLLRTHQTAEPLAKKLNLTFKQYKDLDEIDFGELEGKEFSTIEEKIDSIHHKWSCGDLDCCASGGESPKKVYERANKCVQKILSTSPEQRIAFFIHGRLIRILLSEWLGHGLKNMHLIEHQNGAINILNWEKGEFEAVDLNNVEHLAELA